MNNMKYYNDSLAYDFEMFMPKTKESERSKDNVIHMPGNNTAAKKRRRAAAKSMSVSVFSIMAAVFILAALCGNIGLRIKVNEVSAEINDVKADIAELGSEKTALEVEFQRKISYANIELEATQLGMRKMSKDQVTYIRVNDKNAARTGDGNLLYAE